MEPLPALISICDPSLWPCLRFSRKRAKTQRGRKPEKMFCPQRRKILTKKNIFCKHPPNLRTTPKFSLRPFPPPRDPCPPKTKQPPPHQQNSLTDNSRTPRTPQPFAAHVAASR